MVIDLNKVADEASGQLLPDLNEEPPDEQGDEIHRLQEDHVHLKENEVHRLQEGQAHYFYEGEHRAVHGIDLNIAACEGQQQEPDAVLAVEEDHQQHGDIKFDGPHELGVFNLNLEASNHQQDGDNNFDGPHDYGVFDLNLEASDHQQDRDINFDGRGPHDYAVCDLKLEASDHQQEMQQMTNMTEDMQDYGVYTDALDITFDKEKFEDTNVEDEHANENTAHKSRNLTEVERQEIYAALLAIERSNHGRLKRNATNIVAQMFQVSKYQVQRVWRRVKQCRAQGRPVDVRSRRKNCGRKKIQIDLSDILRVPLHRRSSIRSLANAIGVNKSTLHRRLKEGLLQRYCKKKTRKSGCDGVFPC